MRRAIVVGALMMVACQAPSSVLAPPTSAPGATGSTAPSTHPTPAAQSDTGPFLLVGRLVDGGNWQPGIGESAPAGAPFMVRQRYVFDMKDTLGRTVGTDSVAKVDSVAFYDAFSEGSEQPPPGALGPRAPQYDCTTLALALLCPPTNTPATDLGNYVVYVSPDPIGRATNPNVVGSFQLYIYAP